MSHGIPNMRQWQADQIAEAERLDAEYIARQADKREALRRYVAARNDDRLSRGHVRPEPESYAAAYVIIIAAAMFGALCVWIAAMVLRAITGT